MEELNPLQQQSWILIISEFSTPIAVFIPEAPIHCLETSHYDCILY